MLVEKCKVNLKPDKKFGWKLEIYGCDKTLKEIDGNLAEFSRRYFNERKEIKPYMEPQTTNPSKPPKGSR
jgi:hypothetical protein